MIYTGFTGASQSMTLHAFYADRAAITDRFGAPRVIDSAPMASDLFVTGDCSRLYFSAAGAVFYAQQQ
jgi:hypothetical protein